MIRRMFILIIFALLLTGCSERSEHVERGGLRVVSLAPNVTEILYALGLSNEVVGVSRYSTYPPEAAEKPAVGGTYDPNWEMIISLQPNLVIGLDSQEEIAAQLRQLNIRFLGVAHETISEIMQSILTIGKACGAETEAQELFHYLKNKVGEASSLSTVEKPRVLVCVGHDEGLTRMYVAGKNTFYDELITLAGGINACESKAIKYPEISPESLHTIKPDIVIDIFPLRQGSGQATLKKTESRNSVASNAWKPYRAVLMTHDYASIPGPRFVLLLEDISASIRQN